MRNRQNGQPTRAARSRATGGRTVGHPSADACRRHLEGTKDGHGLMANPDQSRARGRRRTRDMGQRTEARHHEVHRNQSDRVRPRAEGAANPNPAGAPQRASQEKKQGKRKRKTLCSLTGLIAILARPRIFCARARGR